MLNYLGIELNAYGGFYEMYNIIGKGNNFASGLNFILRGGIDAHYYVDGLIPTTGESLLNSEYDTVRMVANETEDYKCVSSSLIFGAIANGDTLNLKAYLMSEIVDYLLGISVVTGIEDQRTQENFSLMSYPNPCKDQVNFEYELKETQHIKIDIYNATGCLIENLIDQKQPPGKHFVSWNVRNNKGMKADKGLYIYRFSSDSHKKTGKIILMN